MASTGEVVYLLPVSVYSYAKKTEELSIFILFSG